ncbi:MAG TPA: metalloregulator ArsR/SmtB family transcription factor [Gemmataceae bacterium]
MTDPKEAQRCAEKLQALAEENRIRIIECLRSGAKNVTQLATMLKMQVVNVSHHLGVLRSKDLVLFEKQGRFARYYLNPKLFNKNGDDCTCLDLGWCRIEIPDA